MIFLSIVIPAYNEKENLKNLIPQLFDKFPAVRIIIVDDNSPDLTAVLVHNLKQKFPQLILLKRSGKLGRGSAVFAGFEKALSLGRSNLAAGSTSVEYILEMDADFSHDPADIDKLLAKKGAKIIVIGSRYVTGSRIINWSLVRRILSKLSNLYIRLLLGIPIQDFTNGFRLYPKKAVEIICSKEIKASGYAALSEIAYRLYNAGYNFVEVPTTFVARTVGKSNTNLAEYFKSLLAILRIRLNAFK